jgi:hypothetical protein
MAACGRRFRHREHLEREKLLGARDRDPSNAVDRDLGRSLDDLRLDARAGGAQVDHDAARRAKMNRRLRIARAKRRALQANPCAHRFEGLARLLLGWGRPGALDVVATKRVHGESSTPP